MEYPDQSLGDLFTDLHLSGLWPDGKVISDAVLLAPADQIVWAYHEAQRAGAVDLKAFFARWFAPVSRAEAAYRTDPAHGPLQHLQALWPHLTRGPDRTERSSRIPLPHPYVVVGGRFQEAYYWDSYFTQLGLLKTGRHALVADMLRNFAWSIGTFGHIPNGFRTYFLTRSQPPFFPSMVRDYGRATGNLTAAYAEFGPEMEAEYQFFRDRRHVDGLAAYADESQAPRVEMLGHDLTTGGSATYFLNLRAACESGWDFSARWYGAGGLETIRAHELWAVDLNSILLVNEEILFEATGKEVYATAAKARRQALQERFFAGGFFRDVEIATGRPTDFTSAAGLFPLWAGAATQAQAAQTVAHMKAHLWAPGGLLTSDVTSGEQWDAPNGWAPLQWIALQGLRRYGYHAEAEDLRRRWLATCDAVFRATGKFVEKYNVMDPTGPSGGGEYALQDGFGWSNGVYLDLTDPV
ncbi:trehalase family glycosidase [Rhodobacter sp. KR11]|uniref:trehalase family glycosidase n=1 Tax=Rhodobacter sp. KR11 TaxID=2974588 RepID=UPI0022219103|nr:trehalase family glycosidase [Rhodobacter sp. KR11]MCW1919311.1 trehalase family glycosidase [Rhodobacter sp. KR11]